MAVTPITLLPTAPARTDTPATFNTRADAFLGALYSPFAGQMNVSIGEFNTDFTTVATNATAAATSATASATSATAAAASATAAAHASAADAWVSGTSYTAGDVVYSPIDFQSYRCILATSGTTDPSADATYWVLISASAGGVTYVAKTTTYTAADLEGVLADTSGGAFTVNLPASPSAGEQVIIADSGGAFGSNNLTTGRNGSTIDGTAADLELDIDGVSVQFVYDGSTWEVYAQVGGNGGSVVTLAGIQTLTNKTLTSPVLTTPALGTPSALVLTNATGTLTSPTFVTPALGTPASGVLTNATGLPNSSVIGLGSAALVATGTTSGKVPLVGTKSSTTTLAGLVERSTSAENVAGTDDTVYPTVAGAKEMINAHASAAHLVTFTDSGSGIASGKPCVLESGGTATQVSGSGTGLGTPVEITSNTGEWIATTFDSTNNKIVEAYKNSSDGNSYGVVGTVSGNAISFGTPVAYDYNTSYQAIAYDSDADRVVIVYRDVGSSDYGRAVVGTVSGTAISFGTPVAFESASTKYIAATFDSDSNKVVIAYQDDANSDYGTAIVGTVSGTSISFGTPVVFESAAVTFVAATFDSNSNKVVIAYKDLGNSEYGTAIVGTVSGTDISFDGSPTVFESAATEYTSATFDSNLNKVVITYRDQGNSDYGTAVVGTVSGDEISFGTPVVYESAYVTYQSVCFDSNANKVHISYKDVGNSNYGTNIVGTVSGTSISFTSPAVFSSATTNYISSAFDSNENAIVIGYTPDAGPWAVVDSIIDTNLTTTNYLGVANEAISASATGGIMLRGGVSSKLTSLTIGSTYYVQADGTFATSASIPSVELGLAVSATTVLMKGI